MVNQKFFIMKENIPASVKPAVDRVYNLIILDESGSMESIKHPTINDFNELIQSIKHSLKETPEIDQWVSFYSFNGSGITGHLPLVHASHLTYLSDEKYRPDNSTPLYDAIGMSVNSLRTSIENEKNYQVLVTILTDGEENASKEYNFRSISALIADLKTKGWVFTYIGANHDVEKTAVSININNYMRFQASEEGTKEMYSKNMSSRRSYIDKLKSGRHDAGSNFFEVDNKKKGVKHDK